MTPILSVTAQKSFTISGGLKTKPTDEVNLNEASLAFNYTNANSKFEIENNFNYSHTNATYDIANTVLQENMNNFNEIKNTLSITNSINSRTAISVALTPSINFQKNIGIHSISILGGFEIHQNIGSNTVLNVGVERNSFLGSPKITPIVSFKQKVNDQINFSLGFPNSNLSYANNERNNFSITNSFNGTFYNLDNSIYTLSYTNAERLHMSQMTTALEYERNIDKNWFLNFKGGYDFNRKYEITQNNGETVHDFNIKNGTVFSFRITYKH